MTTFSRLGLVFSLGYVAICAYLISTQGLFGESFIAIILGLPWTLLLSLFEYGGATGPLLYVLVLLPLGINAVLLYLLGRAIGN